MVVVVDMCNNLCMNGVGIQLLYNKSNYSVDASIAVDSCTLVVVLITEITGI